MKRIIATLVIGTTAVLGMAAPAGAVERTKDAICHPVGSATGGNTGAGYSIISPDKASSHIDEETGEPKHEHDGRVDVLLGDDLLCPGEGENPPPPPAERSRYRITRRMPSVRTKVTSFLAGAQVRIFCHVALSKASVVLRKGSRSKVISLNLPAARNGNTIRVKEDGVLRAKARC